jgi:hypothetical protein
MAIGGLALTGALVGGGAAVAFAQTETTPSTENPTTTAPSTTDPSTTAPSDSTKPDRANCPNMGEDSGSSSSSGTGASTHARPSSSRVNA